MCIDHSFIKKPFIRMCTFRGLIQLIPSSFLDKFSNTSAKDAEGTRGFLEVDTLGAGLVAVMDIKYKSREMKDNCY